MDQHARQALLGEQEVIIQASIGQGVPAFRKAGEALKVIRAATQNGANLHRGRASVIALWQRQIALATT